MSFTFKNGFYCSRILVFALAYFPVSLAKDPFFLVSPLFTDFVTECSPNEGVYGMQIISRTANETGFDDQNLKVDYQFKLACRPFVSSNRVDEGIEYCRSTLPFAIGREISPFVNWQTNCDCNEYLAGIQGQIITNDLYQTHRVISLKCCYKTNSWADAWSCGFLGPKQLDRPGGNHFFAVDDFYAPDEYDYSREFLTGFDLFGGFGTQLVTSRYCQFWTPNSLTYFPWFHLHDYYFGDYYCNGAYYYEYNRCMYSSGDCDGFVGFFWDRNDVPFLEPSEPNAAWKLDESVADNQALFCADGETPMKITKLSDASAASNGLGIQVQCQAIEKQACFCQWARRCSDIFWHSSNDWWDDVRMYVAGIRRAPGPTYDIELFCCWSSEIRIDRCSWTDFMGPESDELSLPQLNEDENGVLQAMAIRDVNVQTDADNGALTFSYNICSVSAWLPMDCWFTCGGNTDVGGGACWRGSKERRFMSSSGGVYRDSSVFSSSSSSSESSSSANVFNYNIIDMQYTRSGSAVSRSQFTSAQEDNNAAKRTPSPEDVTRPPPPTDNGGFGVLEPPKSDGGNPAETSADNSAAASNNEKPGSAEIVAEDGTARSADGEQQTQTTDSSKSENTENEAENGQSSPGSSQESVSESQPEQTETENSATQTSGTISENSEHSAENSGTSSEVDDFSRETGDLEKAEQDTSETNGERLTSSDSEQARATDGFSQAGPSDYTGQSEATDDFGPSEATDDSGPPEGTDDSGPSEATDDSSLSETSDYSVQSGPTEDFDPIQPSVRSSPSSSSSSSSVSTGSWSSPGSSVGFGGFPSSNPSIIRTQPSPWNGPVWGGSRGHFGGGTSHNRHRSKERKHGSRSHSHEGRKSQEHKSKESKSHTNPPTATGQKSPAAQPITAAKATPAPSTASPAKPPPTPASSTSPPTKPPSIPAPSTAPPSNPPTPAPNKPPSPAATPPKPPVPSAAPPTAPPPSPTAKPPPAASPTAPPPPPTAKPPPAAPPTAPPPPPTAKPPPAAPPTAPPPPPTAKPPPAAPPTAPPPPPTAKPPPATASPIKAAKPASPEKKHG